MFLSILTGHVSPENWTRLEQAYAQALHHPPEGMLQSYLIHCKEDPHRWQILTMWQSEAVYLHCKQAGQTDSCVQMFCDAGSMPERTTYEVMRHFELV